MAEKFVIEDAERTQSRLRLAFCGAPGAGKTSTMLRVAHGIAQSMLEMGIIEGDIKRKIGIVDTEHKSARLYQNKMFPDGARVPPFNVIELEAPYSTARYLDAVDTFVHAGFPIIGIDQISHAWAGSGGLLEKKAELAKRDDKNSFSAFEEITPEQNKFIETLLALDAHLIVTMRSHQKYVVEQYTDSRGNSKSRPKRIGMAPIQRGGTEYEFTTVLNLDVEGNVASVIKDRTDIFGPPGTTIGLLTEAHGRALAKWLYMGEVPDAQKELVSAQKRLDAIVKTWEGEFTQCTTLPDLAAAFGKALDAVKAFDIGEYGKMQARAKLILKKDERKAELDTTRATPRDPAVKLVTPDDVIAIEEALQQAKVPTQLFAEQFKIPRISSLPFAQLDDAKDWIDAQNVLLNKSPAGRRARA